MGGRYVFDLEADNLLPKITKIHCIVAVCLDTGTVHQWRPWEVEEGIRFLAEADLLVGHNVIDYDLAAIKKIYPHIVMRPKKVHDTLIMCKIVWPADTLLVRDMRMADANRLPRRLIKSHSLEAWGWRIGNYKGDYKGPWDVWSETMQEYMVQDGLVNRDLYTRILKSIGWLDPQPDSYVWPELPFDTEFEVAAIIGQQERDGFSFDMPAAIRLAQELANAQADIEDQLSRHFGSWWAAKDNPETGRLPKKSYSRKLPQFPNVTVPRFGKGGKPLKPYVGPPQEHYHVDAPFVRIERVTFSPGSRDHIGQRLVALYGWKPKKFGKDGRPTLDESTLAEIPSSVLPEDIRKLLQNYFVITKTLGQLSVGKKSWMASVREDGKIHGRMNTCGAITGRGTHYDPNLSQVPSVVVNDDTKEPVRGIAGGFGYECRSLFTASPGWELTGSDGASLELVILGHYLHPIDGGEFAERVGDPKRDPHTEHGEITGLGRDDTKTATYLVVYGGGGPKLGESLEIDDADIPKLLKHPGLRGIMAWKKRIDGPDYVEPDDKMKAKWARGDIVIKTFFEKMPHLKELKDQVTQIAGERGWLRGIDGRKLYIRKKHAALNTLLQGAGAIICKMWMARAHRALREWQESGTMGLFRQVVWPHDELQFDHEPNFGGLIAHAAESAMKQTGEELKFRGNLRTSAKIGGKNWAETH